MHGSSFVVCIGNEAFATHLEGVFRKVFGHYKIARIIHAEKNSLPTRIVGRIREYLQEQYNCKGVVILADLATISRDIFQQIRFNFPSFYITTINLTYQPAQGLDVLRSVQSLHCALHYSDCVIYRQLFDVVPFLEKETGLVGCTLDDAILFACCDLFVLLPRLLDDASPVNLLWPLNVCHNNRKLIDIRTSTWRALRSLKRRSEHTYDPFKSLCSNLHELHQYHRMSATSSSANTYTGNVPSFSFIDVAAVSDAVGGSDYVIQLISSAAGSQSNEKEAVLKWATPGLTWSTATTSIYTYSLPNESSGADGNKKISRTFSDQRTPALKISCVAFASPYALAAVHRLCLDAEALVNAGAFIHSSRIRDSAEEITDAIEGIRAHLDAYQSL